MTALQNFSEARSSGPLRALVDCGLAGALAANVDQNASGAIISNIDSVSVVLNWTRNLKRK